MKGLIDRWNTIAAGYRKQAELLGPIKAQHLRQLAIVYENCARDLTCAMHPGRKAKPQPFKVRGTK